MSKARLHESGAGFTPALCHLLGTPAAEHEVYQLEHRAGLLLHFAEGETHDSLYDVDSSLSVCKPHRKRVSMGQMISGR